MKDTELSLELNRLSQAVVSSPICAGCGHEHNCKEQGCAIIRTAVDRLTDAGWRDSNVEVPTNDDAVLVTVNGRYGTLTFKGALELAHYYEGEGGLPRVVGSNGDTLAGAAVLKGREVITMPKYKDAETIKQAINKEIEECQKAMGPSERNAWQVGFHNGLTMALAIVLRTPFEDVAPVRYGHWIGEGDGYADGEIVYDVWHCSECDYCIDDGTDDPDLLPKYCPDCGAKMLPQ